MQLGRAVTFVVLMALVAACGGGSDDGGGGGDDRDSEVSLEDWVEDADEICADADEDADELELESPDDIADRGDEALAIAEDAVDEIDDLDRPGGDDEDRAEDLVDGFDPILELQEEILEVVGDGEDELALLSIALDYEDDFEESLDAADEVDSDDCAGTFEERLASLQGVADLLEAAGELADVRVGDCLTGVDDEDTLAPSDCGSEDAEGEVISTIVSTAQGCEEDTERVSASGVSFCIESFGPGPEEDGVLEIGSCILLENGAGDSVDVTEFACSDLAVTHEITSDVPTDESCPARERQFSKSDPEIAATGEGDWCAVRL